MALKSLEEHNKEYMKFFGQPVTWVGTGVACPKCGAELERDLSVVLTSNPPQSATRCTKCDYKGSMY